MGTTTNCLFITFVEKEGPFLKVWGQTDKNTSLFIEQVLHGFTKQFDSGVYIPRVEALQTGILCCAKYKDNKYYRARVSSLDYLYNRYVEVNFLDYGHKDIVPITNIRSLEGFDSNFVSLPPQATCFLLAEAVCPRGEWTEAFLEEINKEIRYTEVNFTVVAQVAKYYLIRLFVGANDLVAVLISKGLVRQTSLTTQEAVVLSMMPQLNQSNQSPGQQNIATYKSFALEPGCQYEVYVSYVSDGPCNFSVQLKQSEELLGKLMKEINSMTLSPVEGIPIPGTVCLARCMEDGHICRAVVTNEVDGKFKIFYVDFGNFEIVALDEMYEIPFKFVIPKVMALRFALAGIDKATVTLEMQCAFKKFVDNRLIHMKVLPMTTRTSLPRCELWDPETHISALDVITHAAATGYPESISLNRGFSQSVRVSFVHSCNKFYVQLLGRHDELIRLMLEIQVYCKDPHPLNTSTIKVGLPCYAKYEGDQQWYRGEIQEILPGGQVKVYYVDYGNEDIVCGTELKGSDGKQLTILRPQAIECCLNGYQNMEANIERDNLLEGIILEQEFTLKVVEKQGKKHLVELIDSSSYNVASLLLDKIAVTRSQVSPMLVQAGNKIEHRKSSQQFNKETPKSEQRNHERTFDSDNSNENSTWRQNNKGFNKSFDRNKRENDLNDSSESEKHNKSFGRQDRNQNDSRDRGLHKTNDRFGRDTGRKNFRERNDGFNDNERTNTKNDDGWGDTAESDNWVNQEKPKFNRDTSHKNFRERNEGFNDNQRGYAKKDDGWGDGNNQNSDWSSPNEKQNRFSKRENNDWNDNSGRNHDKPFNRREKGGWGNKDSERGERKNFYSRDQDKWGNRTEKDDNWGKKDKEDSWSKKDKEDSWGKRDKEDSWGKDKEDSWGKKNKEDTNDNWGGKKDFGSRDRKDRFGSKEKDSWASKEKKHNREFNDSHSNDWDSSKNKDNWDSKDDDKDSWGAKDTKDFKPHKNRSHENNDWGHKGGFKKKTETIRETSEPSLSSSETNFRKGYLNRNKSNVNTNFGRSPKNNSDVNSGNGDEWGTNESTEVPNAAPSTSKFIQPNIENTESNIGISWFHNPAHFYCQIDSSQGDFRRVMEDIQQAYKGRTPSSAVVGQPIIGLFPEDNVLYRGEVLEVTGSEYKVYYVDFGNISIIHKVWPIEKRFMDLPVQAIFCQLNGIEPAAESWLDANAYRQYFNKSLFRCKFLTKESNKVMVQLESDNEDVASLLIKDGLAKSLAPVPKLELPLLIGQRFRAMLLTFTNLGDFSIGLQIGVALTCSIFNLDKSTETWADTLKERVGQILIVYVDDLKEDRLEVTLYDQSGSKIKLINNDEEAFEIVESLCPCLILSPQVFGEVAHVENDIVYLQPSYNAQHLNYLIENSYQFYENNPIETAIIPVEGYLYGIKGSDSNWYRGRVTKIEDTQVTVTYIDYGNSEVVAVDALRDLTAEYVQIPIMCIGINMVGAPEDLVGQDIEVVLTFTENGLEGTIQNDTVPVEPLQVTQKPATESEAVIPTNSNGTLVILSHTDSPSDFYLQLAESISEIDELQAELQEQIAEMVDIETPVIGVLCAAPFTVDQQWYRAQVLDADADITTVRFVDYGNTDVIDNHSAHIKTLLPALISLEVHATRCRMKIRSPEDEWSSAAIERFQQICDCDNLCAQFINQDEKINYVELFANGISVSDTLVQENLAVVDDEIVTTESSSVGFVSHLNSPSEFWIQLENCVEQLEWVAEQLTQAESFAELQDLAPGTLCAALFPDDQMWYRARILSNTVAGIEVIFVDYGNSCMSCSLRELPEHLVMLPPLAQKCSLQKPEGLTQWGPEMVRKLQDISADGQTTFNVKKLSTGETALVELLLDGEDLTSMILPKTEDVQVKSLESLDEIVLMKGKEEAGIFKLEALPQSTWSKESLTKFEELNRDGKTIFQAEFVSSDTVRLYSGLNDIRLELNPVRTPSSTPLKMRTEKIHSSESIGDEINDIVETIVDRVSANQNENFISSLLDSVVGSITNETNIESNCDLVRENQNANLSNENGIKNIVEGLLSSVVDAVNDVNHFHFVSEEHTNIVSQASSQVIHKANTHIIPETTKSVPCTNEDSELTEELGLTRSSLLTFEENTNELVLDWGEENSEYSAEISEKENVTNSESKKTEVKEKSDSLHNKSQVSKIETISELSPNPLVESTIKVEDIKRNETTEPSESKALKENDTKLVDSKTSELMESPSKSVDTETAEDC